MEKMIDPFELLNPNFKYKTEKEIEKEEKAKRPEITFDSEERDPDQEKIWEGLKLACWKRKMK